MKKILGCFLITLLLFSLICLPSRAEVPKTQLEIREFQTRLYDINDYKLVMKAMINVLQDEGYIIKDTNMNMGIVTGTKEELVKGFWKRISGKYYATTEATSNLSEYGKQCKVRVNFTLKYFDGMNNVLKIVPIQDQLFYQEFFSKVDKSIFIQKENI